MFRFRLRTLLLSAGAVALAVGWWSSWPSRTAARFTTALEDHDSKQLARMCPGRNLYDDFQLGDPESELECRAESGRRSISDVAKGSADFRVIVTFVGQTYWGEPLEIGFNVRIERGTVIPAKVPRRRNFATPLATLTSD